MLPTPLVLAPDVQISLHRAPMSKFLKAGGLLGVGLGGPWSHHVTQVNLVAMQLALPSVLFPKDRGQHPLQGAVASPDLLPYTVDMSLSFLIRAPPSFDVIALQAITL